MFKSQLLLPEDLFIVTKKRSSKAWFCLSLYCFDSSKIYMKESVVGIILYSISAAAWRKKFKRHRKDTKRKDSLYFGLLIWRSSFWSMMIWVSNLTFCCSQEPWDFIFHTCDVVIFSVALPGSHLTLSPVTDNKTLDEPTSKP